MKSMKRLCMLALSVWLGMESGPAHAQFSWNPFRKAAPPAPPAERVGQLIGVVKGDADERKRTLAVEELRDFDTKTFPEIVPILADVAQSDPKAGVRAEAVSSLVRIRPVNAMAGLAIEHVATKDENWRNRMNAQAALVRYRLAGYSPSAAARNDFKSPGQGPMTPNQSQEPPLAQRPPVIYYDQNGKVIPAPNIVPGPNPVIGTPTSNPGGKMKLPFFPIAPSSPPPAVPSPLPPSARYQPQPKAPAPASVEPAFRNVNAPLPEPGPFVPLPDAPPLPSIVPGVPTAAPSAPMPRLTPAPTGPSLELPPLPINPTPAPAPAGLSLDVSNPPAPSLLPSGRMPPSPRLTPVAAPMP